MSAAATTTWTMIAVQLAANKTSGEPTLAKGVVGERWAKGGWLTWYLNHLAVGTRMQFQ